jgi:N-acetyl-anhydromuramyl-L-alanine amidase AmpD
MSRYYEGSDSGELDEPTRCAIRSFQEDMRIEPATGELDRQTMVALETVHGY